jgi:poly(3-hydroxybutyrate) depolymerase
LLAAPGERGPASEAGLSRAQAGAALALLWAERRAEIEAGRAAELEAQAVQAEGKTLKLKEAVFGEAPPGGRSLWISLHGGGNAPAELNDGQWLNQSRLYRIDEGIYVAPRAPTNTWNLWHEPHIDSLFDRLIEDYVALRGVNPNRVYLLGYSAGGDGVYQVAPRMADRFAAAAMMAGHPNDASPLGLRNLPFALFVGEKDGGYGRNAAAREWSDKLDRLEREDRGGYPHFVRTVAGKGHWMDSEDAAALPWMAARTRDPWPKRVVWEQGHRIGRRFYWLGVPEREDAAAGEVMPARGALVRAEVAGQQITLATRDYRRLVLRLSDALLDLDRPVTVVANGRKVFSGRVRRTVAALAASLEERADPSSAASVLLEVEM